MAVNSSSPISWTEIVLVSATFLLSYLYYSWTSGYEYWKKRNVPYLKPKFPFGNVADVFLFKKNFRDSWFALYNQLEDNPFGGIFLLRTPAIIIKDPELIKKILTKDFGHFMDHGYVSGSNHEQVLNNIFFMEGEIWKQMRTKLSSAFSSGKMKTMFATVSDCSRRLESCLSNIFQAGVSFEAKQLMSRYTFDTIVTSLFGLQATAVDNGNCELYRTACRMFSKSLRRSIANIVFVEARKWYSRFKMHMFQFDACEDFFEVIIKTLETREKFAITRNDFLDTLIAIRNSIITSEKDISNKSAEEVGDTDKRQEKNKLKVDDVMGQSVGFFIAGNETSSSALSFCLYELARDPDLQIKLQRELDEAYERHGSQVTYQMLQELPYMKSVISETLRMYSSLPALDRICVKEYKIPGTEVVIEKGCRVVIPSYGIHHDPKYYPDPFKFDPDRFTEENVKSRPAYTHLPFGEGPRICLGMRFAMMQMRLALVAVFTQFNVKLNPKTLVPLTIDYGEFITRSSDEIFLDLCVRNDFATD